MNALNVSKSSIYVLFGYPGAGKGTFGQMLRDAGHDYDQVSTGEIIREELAKGTEFGLKYKELIEQGKWGIPPDEVLEIIDHRLHQKVVVEKKGIVLDGFPRTLEQSKFLDDFIKRNRLAERTIFVLIDVKSDIAKERTLFRQNCSKCNRIYNSVFSPSQIPGQCDRCNGKLEARLCDNQTDIVLRHHTFEKILAPVIQHYRNLGCLLQIDGNPGIETCLKSFSDFHDRLMKV